MNYSKKFTLVLASIIPFLVSTALWFPPSWIDSSPEVVSNTEVEKIKETVRTCFEIRYLSLNTLQLGDFGNIMSKQSDSTEFWDAELGKLAVEIKHAELNRLGYVDYSSFLDFEDSSIDNVTQTATVSLTIRHDVIYQISLDLEPENPTISHLYNLEHRILMRFEQGHGGRIWIESDPGRGATFHLTFPVATVEQMTHHTA